MISLQESEVQWSWVAGDSPNQGSWGPIFGDGETHFDVLLMWKELQRESCG